MATTYTVDNTFTAGTTAVASEVNANFTNLLNALNLNLDASNLSTGTIALARISGLTTSQFAANVIDTDDALSADSDTRIASQSATKSYVDGKTWWTYDGSTVFNTSLTAANTWQSLDLSAYVGSNRALCYAKVTAGGALDGWGFGLDETGAWTPHTAYAGANNVAFAGASDSAYVTFVTNSNGTITHAATNNATSVTIQLLGYLK
jgi:hypothetical protein